MESRIGLSIDNFLRTIEKKITIIPFDPNEYSDRNWWSVTEERNKELEKKLTWTSARQTSIVENGTVDRSGATCCWT